MRILKASKEATYKANILNGPNKGPKNGECLSKNHNEEVVPLEADKIRAESMLDNLSSPRKKRKLNILDITSNKNATDAKVFRKIEYDNQEKGPLLVNENVNTPECYQQLKPSAEKGVPVWKILSCTEKREPEIQELGLCNKAGVSGPGGPAKPNVDKLIILDDVVKPPYDDMMVSQPLPSVTKETQAASIVSQPGYSFFNIFSLYTHLYLKFGHIRVD